MIDPGPDDVGRPVIYRPTGDHGREEEGEITGMNSHYVFVKFAGSQPQGIAVHRRNLEWAPEPPIAA